MKEKTDNPKSSRRVEGKRSKPPVLDAPPRPLPRVPRRAELDQPEVRDIRRMLREESDRKPNIQKPSPKDGCSKYFLMLAIVVAAFILM